MKQKSKAMQKMSCTVCLDDQCELFKDKICNCNYCYYCALDWIEEKITQKQNIDSFPCLNHKCKQIITFEHFFNSIKDKQIQLKYQEIMLKNYLQITQDIRPCPNPKCNEYAFLPQNRCGKEFTCRQCDKSWLDKNYLSYEKLFILKLKEFKSDAFSDIFEFFLTQQCPRCYSKIQKNGGCSHMTCKKCNFYYCWLCNNELKEHYDQICAFRVMTYVSLLIFNIINTLYVLDWLKHFVLILYPIYGIMLTVLFNAYPILPIVFLYTIFYTIKYRKQRAQYQKKLFLKSQLILLAVELFFILVLILGTMCNLIDITLSQFINYHYYQGICIGIVAIIITTVYSFNEFIYKNWLKFLI